VRRGGLEAGVHTCLWRREAKKDRKGQRSGTFLFTSAPSHTPPHTASLHLLLSHCTLHCLSFCTWPPPLGVRQASRDAYRRAGGRDERNGEWRRRWTAGG